MKSLQQTLRSCELLSLCKLVAAMMKHLNFSVKVASKNQSRQVSVAISDLRTYKLFAIVHCPFPRPLVLKSTLFLELANTLKNLEARILLEKKKKLISCPEVTLFARKSTTIIIIIIYYSVVLPQAVYMW